MTHAFDICIRGAGIVGRTLALLLARERLRVALVAQAPTPERTPDVRAYALNARSRAVLESVRCWPESDQATAVLTMQVKGDEGGLVNFSAAEMGVPALTWIVDVPALESRLQEALRYQQGVELVTAPVAAALTVICDGRHSSARTELGIEHAVTCYAQHAIAARINCDKPHGQLARQWFTKDGILAFLPLEGPAGNSVAIVWSAPKAQAQNYLDESPDDFCKRLELASEGGLGRIALASGRKSWPLQMAQAQRWFGTHDGITWALAGDAAHSVHPLAGQGLNLGLSDAADLTGILHQREYWRELGDEKLLRRYERSRRTEVLAMSTAMDALQQLFNQPSHAWQSARNWGMNRFEHSGPIKQWVARQAMGL